MQTAGWKTDSKQPERYARIVTKDVDSYYAKKMIETMGVVPSLVPSMQLYKILSLITYMQRCI